MALAALRGEGVLIIGSGSMTHNLAELRGDETTTLAPPWVIAFDLWMQQKLLNGDRTALLDYRQLAPDAQRNHPTEEHLLPLFVALGAAGEHVRASRIHGSVEYGVLAMAAYAFD